MEILNTVRDTRRGRPIGLAGRIEPGENEMWKAIEIVANALDMEVDIRLATQEHLHEKREAQKKVRSVDQIRVDSQARDRARLRPTGPTRIERAEKAAADRKAATAKEVIDAAASMLEGRAENEHDWSDLADLRVALDAQFGVKRDA